MAGSRVEKSQRMAKMKRWQSSKPRKPIRRFSTRRAALSREYARRAKDFLVRNAWCAWGLKQTPPQHIRATQVHHTRGRIGRLLLDERFWVAVSAAGHEWIHRNIEAARQLGLICERGLWNTPAPISAPGSERGNNREGSDTISRPSTPDGSLAVEQRE